MIKNILLPEKIDSYYLFAQRLIGLDIGKTHIHATQLFIRGNQITVEKCITETIEANTTPYPERASKVLKELFVKLDRPDHVYSSLSSAVVLFKNLKLPFTEYDKIQKVIPFEVEPLLPFSINNAVIDFIVTSTNIEEQQTDVLVATVPKQHIAQHLQLFEQAGIDPSIVTVDLFALYGLYQQIPAYTKIIEGVVLIDLGFQTTRLAYIHNNQLKQIRSINKGMATLAKAVAKMLSLSSNQAIEHIIRFGLEKEDWPEYTQAAHDAWNSFWQDIQFTLASFTTPLAPDKTIAKLLLFGGGAETKGITNFVKKQLDMPCELFNTKYITEQTTIQVKNNGIPRSHLISLSSVIPSPLLASFNLRKDEFSVTDPTLFYKQVIVTVLLSLSFLGILFAYYYHQTSRLARVVKQAEQGTLEILQEQFKRIPEDEDLDDAKRSAETEVAEAQKTWFAFSAQARASFLKYLLELSTIDKDALGLIVEKITISADGFMQLQAQIRGHEELKILERELRKSKLFSYVEPQDKLSFTMTIQLVKNNTESS